MPKNNSPEHMAAMRAACTPEVRAGSKQIAALKERIHRHHATLQKACKLAAVQKEGKPFADSAGVAPDVQGNRPASISFAVTAADLSRTLAGWSEWLKSQIFSH